MNARKPVDYSSMFTTMDKLIAMGLPQMELYHRIGNLVNERPEKGAAVAASEHLSKTYPGIFGFSPRNLRRMRKFCRAYENAPEILTEAMMIGWTRNTVIFENCETSEERAWYIRAVRQFNWSKMELLSNIIAKAYQQISLDFTDEICYTEENSTTKETPSNAAAQDPQRHRTGNAGPADGTSSLLHLHHSQLLHRGVYTQLLLVRRRRGRSLGVANGAGAGVWWPTANSSPRKQNW